MAVVVSMQEVIPQHQEILRAGSKLLALTRDVSSYAVKGASSINYPTLAKRTAQTKALNGTFDVNNASYGDDILSLNQKIGDAFDVEQHQEKQNKLRSLEDNSKNTLAAMGEDIDKKIYIALRAATVGDYVVPTSDFYADVVDMAKKLDDAHVPQTGRILMVSSADYAKLLKTKDFVRFDGVGQGANIQSGVVGEILGFKVVKLIVDLADQDDTAQQSIAWHTNGVITAIQGETLLMSSAIPESTKMRYSISDLFGCKCVQVAGSGNSINTPYAVRLGAAPA